MAIYGVGAFYEDDVAHIFVANNLVGVGWNEAEAPELKAYFKALRVGDIVYIKAFPPGQIITIKGIGVIRDSEIRTAQDTGNLVQTGRNVLWLCREWFQVQRPTEKNNVRSNTVYEEFHPDMQREILERIQRATTVA